MCVPADHPSRKCSARQRSLQRWVRRSPRHPPGDPALPAGGDRHPVALAQAVTFIAGHRPCPTTRTGAKRGRDRAAASLAYSARHGGRRAGGPMSLLGWLGLLAVAWFILVVVVETMIRPGRASRRAESRRVRELQALSDDQLFRR